VEKRCWVQQNNDRRGLTEQLRSLRCSSGQSRGLSLTHELLAQYVGTSLEIVTHYMTQFRRQGYLRYSRQGITIYREAFCQSVVQNV
jgi:CRP-like cAMP-binding protein